MKLISARQSWHDAFYAQADSTVNSVIKVLVSGVSKSTGYGFSGGWKKTKPTKYKTSTTMSGRIASLYNTLLRHHCLI
jgi:hypothetical protein